MIYFLPVFRHKYFTNLFTVIYFKKLYGAGETLFGEEQVLLWWVLRVSSQVHISPQAVISSPASRCCHTLPHPQSACMCMTQVNRPVPDNQIDNSFKTYSEVQSMCFSYVVFDNIHSCVTQSLRKMDHSIHFQNISGSKFPHVLPR